MNVGVDVMHCMDALAPDVVEHIREMMARLWGSVGLVINPNESTEEKNERLCMFFLTKLLSSVMLDDDDPDDANETRVVDKMFFETNIYCKKHERSHTQGGRSANTSHLLCAEEKAGAHCMESVSVFSAAGW